MHNRARLVTVSFLTKNLRVDWRAGAAHFFRWLVDGDVANNAGNWQWVAGTGNDTHPNRVLNPLRQARRFDPDGAYVRRYVPELRDVDGAAVHTPWTLPDDRRGAELSGPADRRLMRRQPDEAAGLRDVLGMAGPPALQQVGGGEAGGRRTRSPPPTVARAPYAGFAARVRADWCGPRPIHRPHGCEHGAVRWTMTVEDTRW